MGRAKRNPSIASTEMLGFASLYPSSNSARPHPEELAKQASSKDESRDTPAGATWFETALTRLLSMRSDSCCAAPPSLIVSFGVRPLYARLRADVVLPTKNMGGNHDKLTDLSRFPTTGR